MKVFSFDLVLKVYQSIFCSDRLVAGCFSMVNFQVDFNALFAKSHAIINTSKLIKRFIKLIFAKCINSNIWTMLINLFSMIFFLIKWTKQKYFESNLNKKDKVSLQFYHKIWIKWQIRTHIQPLFSTSLN